MNSDLLTLTNVAEPGLRELRGNEIDSAVSDRIIAIHTSFAQCFIFTCDFADGTTDTWVSSDADVDPLQAVALRFDQRQRLGLETRTYYGVTAFKCLDPHQAILIRAYIDAPNGSLEDRELFQELSALNIQTACFCPDKDALRRVTGLASNKRTRRTRFKGKSNHRFYLCPELLPGD
jgi:hypothetical protein